MGAFGAGRFQAIALYLNFVGGRDRQPVDLVVVGCGVSGLTTATCLQERGHRVRIVARELPPNTTSNVAAAYWWPFGIEPSELNRRWAELSYQRFAELSSDPRSGIFFVPLYEFTQHSAIMPWVAEIVPDFRHLDPAECPPRCDGFVATVPVVESGIYLEFLAKRFIAGGGRIEHQKVQSLSELLDADLVVNCAGVWAGGLADDPEVYPIQGQVLRVTKPVGVLPRIVDVKRGDELTYIIPRSNDYVLGGTYIRDCWELKSSDVVAKEIFSRCLSVFPELGSSTVLETVVGVRAGRVAVRVEQGMIDGKVPVVHNYGHCGSGFTLSWGSAERAAEIATTYADRYSSVRAKKPTVSTVDRRPARA